MHSRIEKELTPSDEEQVLLILQGKCPHNQGWRYEGHGHDDAAYECIICGEIAWY
jgi:hypothetical protein